MQAVLARTHAAPVEASLCRPESWTSGRWWAYGARQSIGVKESAHKESLGIRPNEQILSIVDLDSSIPRERVLQRGGVVNE